MSSQHRLTRSFRSISALLYLLNIVVAMRFAWTPNYLHIYVGLVTSLACLLMLAVTLEAPKLVMDRLEHSNTFGGEVLFTFRGRYVMDFCIAMFLFGMGALGIVAGAATLLLIFGIRFLGVKQPDAFNEIFRQQSDSNSSINLIHGGHHHHHHHHTTESSTGDSYTLESEYDTRNSNNHTPVNVGDRR